MSNRCLFGSVATETSSLSPCLLSPCNRLVRRSCAAAGVPARLSHPHALRAYRARDCLEAGVPVHTVSAPLGHVDLRTTVRYAAARPEQIDDVADVLDRRSSRPTSRFGMSVTAEPEGGIRGALSGPRTAPDLRGSDRDVS